MSEIRTMTEIEAENEWLLSQQEEWSKDKRYNYQDVSQEGIVIDNEMAKDILRSVGDSNAFVAVDSYRLISDKYSSVIVGVDFTGKGVFTVEIPAEIQHYVNDPLDMSKTLEFMSTRNKEYRSIASKVKIGMLLATLALTGLIIFCYKNNYGSTIAILGAVLSISVIFSKEVR